MTLVELYKLCYECGAYGDDYYYECIEAVSGVSPVSEPYPNIPHTGGFHDSIERMEKWLTTRIAFLDSEFNYNQN